jgi:hypothetical protein
MVMEITVLISRTTVMLKMIMDIIKTGVTAMEKA